MVSSSSLWKFVDRASHDWMGLGNLLNPRVRNSHGKEPRNLLHICWAKVVRGDVRHLEALMGQLRIDVGAVKNGLERLGIFNNHAAIIRAPMVLAWMAELDDAAPTT